MTTKQLLNELTANLAVLYFKLHQHHFYVKGHHFFELHEKFETLYNEVHEQLDEVAERNIMLHDSTVSTLSEFLELSTIKEAPYTTPKASHDMVRETLEDFKVIVSILEKGLEMDLDNVTEDLLIGLKASYDKHVWMLAAFVA